LHSVPTASALFGGAVDKAYGEAAAKLYPDKAKLDVEETGRFTMLEEHWDVVVMSAD
jgi:hypothetical protein